MENEMMAKRLDGIIDKLERKAGMLVDMEQTKPLSKEGHVRFVNGIADAYFVSGLLKNSQAMFGDDGDKEDDTCLIEEAEIE